MEKVGSPFAFVYLFKWPVRRFMRFCVACASDFSSLQLVAP